MRRLSLVLVCLGMAAAGASAQTPQTVADLVQRALEGNLDLARSRAALEKAREALPWESELAKTRASVTGGYDLGTRQAGAAQATAKVEIPVLPQLSLGVSVASQGTAGASVSVSPFAAAATRYKEQAAYDNAAADLAWQTQSLTYEVESAAYDAARTATEARRARDRQTLSERSLAVAEKAYELDGITWDELESSRSELNDARQSVYDTQRASLSARVKLYQLVGPSGGEPAVAEVTLAALETLIAERDARIAQTGGAPAVTLSLTKARIALTELRAQLKATPTYRPTLNLGADVSYAWTPAVGVRASGSVSFSFSPSDVQTDARADLEASIRSKAVEVELEALAATFQGEVASQALGVARAALESRRAAWEQATRTLREAELLYQQGERTEIELEEARLSVRSAESALLGAAADVLSAQADVLLLRVL